jgi:hypothetical protein
MQVKKVKFADEFLGGNKKGVIINELSTLNYK